jgi:hypothetical protein
MRKYSEMVKPALAGALLTGFVASLGAGTLHSPQASYSMMDGRPLHTFPEPSRASVTDGAWMGGVEAWIDDHVPARRRWLKLHAGVATKALQVPVVNNVYVGDAEGMQLEKLPAYRVPTSLGRNAEALGKAVRAAGSQVLFVYVPRKEEVFADRYPAAWGNTLPETRKEVLDAFSRGGPVLDLTRTLSDPQRRDEYFFRTDHHWTPAGALVALDAISREAASMGFAIQPDARSYKEKRYPDFYGSLARKTTAAGVTRPDHFVVPTPPKWLARSCHRGICDQPSFVRKKARGGDIYTNRYAAYLGGDNGYQPLYNSSKPGAGKVIMLKDSLGNAVSTYLAERVSKVITIDERLYAGADIKDVVQREKPQLVIVMHNQATMLGNPQFDSTVWVDVKKAVAARKQGDG